MFSQGDRVIANGKSGRVAFIRYAPPDFSQVDAVSVILDERKHDPRYKGSIFPAEQVQKELT